MIEPEGNAPETIATACGFACDDFADVLLHSMKTCSFLELFSTLCFCQDCRNLGCFDLIGGLWCGGAAGTGIGLEHGLFWLRVLMVLHHFQRFRAAGAGLRLGRGFGPLLGLDHFQGIQR